MDDPILGFATDWVNALASECEAIDVITMRQGTVKVAPNVRVFSAGLERGYSKPRRVVNFYILLLRLLFSRRYDACFAHMMPLFAGLGGVFLRLFRIPITIWYTHRQVNRQLRLGLFFSHRVISAVPTSFPIQTPKFRAVGHAIDTYFYSPGESKAPAESIIIHVGRLTAIKNQHTLIRALPMVDANLVLVGDVPLGYDDEYKHHLEQLRDELHLQDQVTFTGQLSPSQVRDWLQRATINVSLTEAGSFDKGVLEGMACAVPTITCNPAFTDMNGDYHQQLFVPSAEDHEALAKALNALLALSSDEQQQIGEHLRQQVIQHHSRDVVMQRILNVLTTGEPT